MSTKEFPIRSYQAMAVVSPALNEEGIQQLSKQLEELIVRQGGKVQQSMVLGKRRLSYPIKKSNEGIYLDIRFEAPSGDLVKIERAIGLIESILRFMVVRPPSRSDALGQDKPASEQESGSLNVQSA